MKVKFNYVFFWGGTFSQWCPSPFEIDGEKYNCCEQYMMAKKALLFGDIQSYKKIMNTKDPKVQKAIGRTVKNFDRTTWEKVCREYVYEGNLAKFKQNPKMLQELLATGKREIVEASPFDTIWGVGLSENDSNILDKTKWKGTNWLGEAIVRVRQTLIEENKLKK
jgi:ribA/ribD-fused uncharacterized protein